MARPKEFDRQHALDQAMELFWLRGYEATTMTDLRIAMGIGRQSLYDTFGDKDQLFQEVLARYVGFNDADIAKWLGKENGLSGIRSFFDARVHSLSSGVRKGCLMINTCVELSLHHESVSSQIRKGLENLRKGFETALSGAKLQGQLSTEVAVADLACFLTSQISGMVVMAKNKVSRKQLRAIADHALRTLS